MVKLPDRYSKIKDEMKGSSSEAAALAILGVGKGGKPGAEVVKPVALRPGIIHWEGDDVSFLVKGMSPKRITGQGLNLDKQLEKAWATKAQGVGTKEFGFFAATAAEQAQAQAAQAQKSIDIAVAQAKAAKAKGSRKKLLLAAAVVVGVALAAKMGWLPFLKI